jgi:hypothetical protein
MKLIHAAAAALSLAIAAPAQAASFLGDTVNGSYYYPNVSTLSANAGDQIVSPSATFDFSTVPGIAATVTGDQISISYTPPEGDTVSYFTTADFNGIVFTDLSASDISGAIVDGSSTLTPSVSFTPDSVDINFSNLAMTASSSVVVDVSFGAVPEPATWAMFLLGFGAIGWTLRSRRKDAVAA